jgi:hypothetical protein
MVAAMAAMILAVVLGVGHVVGDIFFHGCSQFSSQLAGGECVAPTAPTAPAAGDGNERPVPVEPAASVGQGADDVQQGTNDLGSSDDM